MDILVINGANLNMLGSRQPEIYGRHTLAQINAEIKNTFSDINFEFFQSNFEGEIVEKIQSTNADGVVINAGGHTHYSIVIRDAILSRTPLPFIEVHLTNPKEREPFRRISLLEDICVKTFSGNHKDSYLQAVSFLKTFLLGAKHGKV